MIKKIEALIGSDNVFIRWSIMGLIFLCLYFVYSIGKKDGTLLLSKAEIESIR